MSFFDGTSFETAYGNNTPLLSAMSNVSADNAFKKKLYSCSVDTSGDAVGGMVSPTLSGESYSRVDGGVS